uniref:J domain-containing protein n=1 Tax=Araucaria cunninghamii TaxID=56994 RepID=A0A0D6R5J7_ARACU
MTMAVLCTENPMAGFNLSSHHHHNSKIKIEAFQTRTQMRMLPNNLSFRGLNPSSVFLPSPRRYARQVLRNCKIVCTAASAGGGSSASSDDNPYKVLGVSPLERFEKIKASYTKKYKDAERRGDEIAMGQLERAYDKIMMAQLSSRKQGITFGSVKVSKDIKYADKQPIIPWAPRYARSEKRDILINVGISAFCTVWMLFAGSADFKPLQLLIAGYSFRIFQKLKDFQRPEMRSASEDVEEEERQSVRTGKRLLRSLGLVFMCVALASLAYAGILNVIELGGSNIPRSLADGQELLVTIFSAILLFCVGSYYR